MYIPARQGKERRKRAISKEGLLGVEGMDTETLIRLLRPYTQEGGRQETPRGEPVTKTDFYEAGLSGGTESVLRRRRFAEAVDLPLQMSSNALLEAVNLLYTREQYQEIVRKISSDEMA